jgi:hypothetical protein
MLNQRIINHRVQTASAFSFYPKLYATVKKGLERRGLLELARTFRYLFLLGPWRGLAIRFCRVLSRVSQTRQPMSTADESLFPKLDLAQIVKQLDDEGYAPGFALPAEQVEQLVAYSREHIRFFQINAHHDCAAAQRIAHDPQIVEVARRYLGTEPILFTTQLYWSRPTAEYDASVDIAEQELHTERFHYDVADFKALSVFIYLTDIEAECGPHVVIPATHKGISLARIFRRYLSDAEAYRRYGDRIKVITAPRGFGFFEDLTCYHKRAKTKKVRLMLSLHYVLRRNPHQAQVSLYP